MEIVSSAVWRSGRSYTLLKSTPLRRGRDLGIVTPTQINDEIPSNLAGDLIESEKTKSLNISFTMWDPLGLKNSSYSVTVKFSPADIGALVEAATGDPILAEHVLKKSRQQSGRKWFIQGR